jgi:solute:Na+ symporter, SSS family
VGTGLHWIDAGMVVVYLAVLAGIGVYFSRRQSSLEDFFLARRGMAWLPVGLSLMAALNSGIDYLMQPSAVIKFGGIVVITVFSWVLIYPYVSRITLPFYRRLNIYSAYEYLERRFDVRVRSLAAGIFLLWRLGWMATALYVPCLAVSAVTSDRLLVPMIVVLGSVVTVYTALGGIKAVVWTDVVQFCIMFCGLAVTVVVVVVNVPGGLSEIWETARAAGKLSLVVTIPGMSDAGLFEKVRLFFAEDITLTGLIVAAMVGRMTLYTSDQVMVQRLQTTRSLRDARQAFIVNAVADALWMIILAFVGLALYAYFQHVPLPEGLSSDKVFPYFMARAFPVGVTGLVIAAIFAASLSSLDSAINSCTSVVVVDFYNRLYLGRTEAGGNLSEEQQRAQIRVSRFATVILGIVGMILAANVQHLGSILEIANKIIQSFTGPIFGIFILGMFTGRARSGAVLIGGSLGVLIACYVAFLSELSFLWPSAFGLAMTLVAGYGLSVLVPAGRVQAAQQLTWSAVLSRRNSVVPGAVK